MKKLNSLHFTALIAFTIFLSSCGKQLYSYRDKVTVKKETAIVKAEPKAEMIENKKFKSKRVENKLPENKVAQIESKSGTDNKKIEGIIQESLPASGSKTAIKQMRNQVNDVKKQFKALHKELKKQDIKEKQGLVSSPIKWMVVGLILIVIGAILGLLVSAGGFIAWVGGLIFLIGLLFWLLEMI
ncbi:MAG: hypothetical protein ACOVP1_02030 [Bacteroidia bacterium]